MPRAIQKFVRNLRKTLRRKRRNLLSGSSTSDLRLPRNEKLPFEILGKIMQILGDDVNHSEDPNAMDRIRLVCRSWMHAADGHPTLWSTIVIRMGSHRVTFWLQYVRTRLRRSGAAPFLEISLLDSADRPWWPLFPDRGYYYSVFCEMLDVLVGEEGEVAARWKRFTYHGLSIPEQTPEWLGENIEHLLSFSTPHLELVEIVDLQSSSPKPLLPWTPSLKSLTWRNNDLHALRGLSMNRPLLLKWVNLSMGSRISPLLYELPQAQNLVLLAIVGYVPWEFPEGSTFPMLLHLLIAGSSFNDRVMQHFSAPNIQTLALCVPPNEMVIVLERSNLSLAKLRQLDLKTISEPAEGLPPTPDIYAIAPNLQRLGVERDSRFLFRIMALARERYAERLAIVARG